MTETKDSTSKSTAAPKADELTEEQTAVLQLVTIAPAPRTVAELANSYAGLQAANLWPEQSVGEVEKRLKELLDGPLLKYGDEAPGGDKTVELTAVAQD